MQAPLSPRLVERSLKLDRGWLEVGLGAEVKLSDSYWGPAGQALDYDPDNPGAVRFMYSTESLNVRYGLLPRLEAGFRLPVHYVSLTNDINGADTSGIYWGDPTLHMRFEAFRTDAPLTSVVVHTHFKAPMGNESPGSLIAGPSTFQSFVTTTGTPDWRLGVEAKRQLGIFGVQGGVAADYRFSGVAQYLVDTETIVYAGRMKPGNRLLADVGGMVQLGPLNLHGAFWFMGWGEIAYGTTSAGLLPNQNLEAVAGSGGYSYGIDARATVAIGRRLDLAAGANIPLRGEDLMFFPIEDLHPTRGITWGGSLSLRF